MMEKGFLGKRIGVWLTLLASVAGVSGNLVAAEIRDVRIATTETGTRVVLDLSAPVKHKAFLLDDPGRVVLDVSQVLAQVEAARRRRRRSPSMRSGKLPHSGLRLVFEVAGPVTIQTSRWPRPRAMRAIAWFSTLPVPAARLRRRPWP